MVEAFVHPEHTEIRQVGLRWPSRKLWQMGPGGARILAVRAEGVTFEVPPAGQDLVPNAPATVLVVEDEETICEIVARFLEDDGLVCVTAGSGEAALEWLHTNKPWPDLFIIDVRLPGMSGPEFALEALRIRQGTPILYISGYSQALLEDRPVSDTVAFLAKPFSYEQLLGEVRRLQSIGSPAQGS